MNAKNETIYTLGHSAPEIQRLKTQAEIIRPITERLLLNAGIQPGMRILDIGCGAGDVAMLAAERVGAAGSVVAIDRNPEVLMIARDRAQASGLSNIVFELASAESFANKDLFDIVIGRYVLIHQSDPVALLRAAACLVKPGGAVAFHEIRLRQKCGSMPNVPLFELIEKLIRMAFSSALSNYYVGDRLIQCFSDAGLPQPKLFCEIPIWYGADAPCRWLVDTLRSLLPQLHRMGITFKELVAIDALENQLRDAIVASRSQISGPAQICAWARL
jgi:ubiquinone/menaquinone biosynthesis C-methylase UbiE